MLVYCAMEWGKEEVKLVKSPNEVTPHTGCCRVHYSYTWKVSTSNSTTTAATSAEDQVLGKASPYFNSMKSISFVQSASI
jgi:hypothetical protein